MPTFKLKGFKYNEDSKTIMSLAKNKAILQYDKNLNLISFTGSTKIGRKVNEMVSQRFGKTILELGGNNAMIVCEDAEQEMALNAIFFSALGTSGQRCTSLRRLFLHEKIYDQMIEKLLSAYD